jgi:hypothetical protein
MREIGTARQMNARALRTLSGNMLLSLSTALFPPRERSVPRRFWKIPTFFFFFFSCLDPPRL